MFILACNGLVINPNTHPVIETQRLGCSYNSDKKAWVLDDINLSIDGGTYVLVCGASGSGKSTLGRTFNGLIPHFYPGVMQGEVRIQGIDTKTQAVLDLFGQVGMVFQNPEAQLFNGTVAREIAFGLESLGLERTEIRERIQKAAASTGLTTLLDRNPHQLSGGEQQLTAITAILSLDPPVIVLDEPYANLDPKHVLQIRDLLKQLHRHGKTIIVNEHRLACTLPDVERVYVLDQGRVVFQGPPRNLRRKQALALGLEWPFTADIESQPGRAQVDVLEPLKQESLESSIPNESVVLVVEGISGTGPNGFRLDRISFKLHKGECIALLGANGSGKTTLLKHLNGLKRPSSGQINVCGQNTLKLKTSQLARYIGVAFQNPTSQFFKLTVENEIRVGPEVLNCLDSTWLDELIHLFGLQPLLKRSPHRLSGGEKKRVAFAAALAAKPAILALDEPTAGQDGYFRKALSQFLMRLRNQGQAILCITHDLAFARQNCPHWLILSHGRLIAKGASSELMADRRLMRQAGLTAET